VRIEGCGIVLVVLVGRGSRRSSAGSRRTDASASSSSATPLRLPSRTQRAASHRTFHSRLALECVEYGTRLTPSRFHTLGPARRAFGRCTRKNLIKPVPLLFRSSRSGASPYQHEHEDDDEYENDSDPYNTSRLRSRLTKARMTALGSPRR
jgi:hypothetical protein